MRLMHSAVFAFSLIVLASCTSQEENFEKAIPILKESPTARATVIDKCESQHLPPETLDEIASYIGSRSGNVKQVLCQRLMKGLVSGKITYADFKTLFQQKKFTPAMVSAFKGR